MADLSVIKEYLVRLGFEADNAQYARVQQVLDRLSFTVQQHTSGIAKTFVGMGIAVTGVYAAIGTATLTMMEKVARADLGYQLYAQRMYLSVGAARQLKIATDALGYSLDEIAWNPELRARLGELIRIQNVMGKGVLGGDFEASMKGDSRHHLRVHEVQDGTPVRRHGDRRESLQGLRRSGERASDPPAVE